LSEDVCLRCGFWFCFGFIFQAESPASGTPAQRFHFNPASLRIEFNVLLEHRGCEWEQQST